MTEDEISADWWNERHIENVADGMFIETWSNMIEALHWWRYRHWCRLPCEPNEWTLPSFWNFDRNLKFGGWS